MNFLSVTKLLLCRADQQSSVVAVPVPSQILGMRSWCQSCSVTQIVYLFLFKAQIFFIWKQKNPLHVGLVPLTCFFLNPDMRINCVKIIFTLKKMICEVVITQHLSSLVVSQRLLYGVHLTVNLLSQVVA